MKISTIRSQIVALPNDEPLAGFSENPNATNPIVTLKIATDDGIEGIGVTYFGGRLTATLKRAVDELGALTIGDDPLRVEAIAAKLAAAAGGAGPGRDPDDGHVGDRRGAMGHQGQGFEPAVVEVAGGRA